MKNILIYAILLYSFPQLIKAQSQTNICSSEKKRNQTMVNADNWHCGYEGCLVFAIFTAYRLPLDMGYQQSLPQSVLKPNFCFSVIK